MLFTFNTMGLGISRGECDKQIKTIEDALAAAHKKKLDALKKDTTEVMELMGCPDTDPANLGSCLADMLAKRKEEEERAAEAAAAEADDDLVPEEGGPPPEEAMEEAMAPAEAVAAQMIVPLQPWHGGHY